MMSVQSTLLEKDNDNMERQHQQSSLAYQLLHQSPCPSPLTPSHHCSSHLLLARRQPLPNQPSVQSEWSSAQHLHTENNLLCKKRNFSILAERLAGKSTSKITYFVLNHSMQRVQTSTQHNIITRLISDCHFNTV